jgi:hypothetical protein
MPEVTPPFQTRTYIEADEVDLSRYVAQVYGRPWRMQQGEMLGQNTYRVIDVGRDGADGFFGVEQAQLDAWLALPNPGDDWAAVMHFERDQYLPVDIILWDLCRRDLIPAGLYLIKIWW